MNDKEFIECQGTCGQYFLTTNGSDAIKCRECDPDYWKKQDEQK